MSNDNYKPGSFTVSAFATRVGVPRLRAKKMLQALVKAGYAKVVSRPGRAVWHYSWCATNKLTRLSSLFV